jgi:hypothetical protein
MEPRSVTDLGRDVQPLLSGAASHLQMGLTALLAGSDDGMIEAVTAAHKRLGAALVLLGSHTAQERAPHHG